MSSRPLSFVVVHPEALAAEAIAMALGRYPGLMAAGRASSATEGLRFGARAHAVVIHGALVGAMVCVRRLHALGVHGVVLGPPPASGPWPRVSLDAPLHELASLLTPDAAAPEAVLGRLTPREREVLDLVADGLAGKQIARVLGISPKTVERHKTRIYSKMGVPNQAAAVGLMTRHPFDHGETRWNLSSM
jgi:DNA-binding CsgD family transcriptional regulator